MLFQTKDKNKKIKILQHRFFINIFLTEDTFPYQQFHFRKSFIKKGTKKK